jgi:TctA family transporter
MVLLVFVGLVVCFISSIITLGIGRIVLSRIRRVSYSRITMVVIAFLIAMVSMLSGPAGLLAALTGTLIGLIAVLGGVKRSHLMGFLLLPTILYFSGQSPFILVTLGI